jgi:predicted amidohydrolase YtcJ
VGHSEAREVEVTLDAALLGLDSKVGSLESGNPADFSVLEQDPHAVNPAEIRNIAVRDTLLGGRVSPSSEIGKR